MIVKTSELKGRALDWAVALTTGKWSISCLTRNYGIAPEYSKSWDKCGELIDKYGIELSNELVNENWIYYATCPHLMGEYSQGDNPKIAICRAVVISEFGDEVDIPDDLVGEDE